MNPNEAVRQIRDAMQIGGDAEAAAAACAMMLDVETVQRIAALWLMEAARNAERRTVREVEKVALPSRETKAHRDAAAIEANVRRIYRQRSVDDQDRLVRRAIQLDVAPRTPRKWTTDRHLWESVTPRGISWAAGDEESEVRLRREVNDSVARFATELKAGWTAELRAQSFTVNGQSVTWGAATIQQHEVRAQAFEQTSFANAESAARHRRAITDLTSASADCLDALTMVSVEGAATE